MKWSEMQYGCTRAIVKGVGDMRVGWARDDYAVHVFGAKLPQNFADIVSAKRAAIREARRVLALGLAQLDDAEVPS